MENKKKHPGGRPVEYTPEKLKELSDELIECVKKDDVFHISYFECVVKDHNPGWLKKIAERHNEFRAILKKAQKILGNKIMSHAMMKGGDRWVINTLTPMYMDDIKKTQDDEKELEVKNRMRIEKYKNSLNAAREEEAIAHILNFDKSTETQAENIRIKKFLADKGLLEELEDGQGKNKV